MATFHFPAYHEKKLNFIFCPFLIQQLLNFFLRPGDFVSLRPDPDLSWVRIRDEILIRAQLLG
jgi:hypothetical protein